ncbi:MAG: GAF domain-containing protein [Nitrospirae bacterium]|nr:GAF domain-containing protein [Nitrospirota bacterium]
MSNTVSFSDEHHDPLPIPRLFPFTIILVALLFIGTIGFSAYLGNHAMKVVSPQMAAVHEMRTEIALAHLWSEEVIMADPNVSEGDVWGHYDRAQWYVDAMLKGGAGYEGELIPVRDAKLRAMLTQAAEKISHCREITKKRLTTKGISSVGSQIDQEYDLVFDDLMAFIHDIEMRFLKVQADGSAIFRKTQIGLLLGCLLLSGGAGIMYFRHNRSRSALLARIAEQNRQLHATNQQLNATEQQLRASNQQLLAGEQQMRSSNQQLLAGEQQLRAANQQLMASEQALRESESRYRSLFSGMSEGVALHRLVYDGQGAVADYEILAVNPQYETILGMHEEQVKGKLATAAYGTDTAPYLAEFSRVAESGIPSRFETYFPPMNKHFDISVAPLEKNGFATIFTDITERKRDEEKIRMNEARLAILWELSQYRAENMQNLLDYALEKAIQLTGSAIGYIYHYSEQKKEFILNSWSKEVMKECLITQPETIYQLEKTGIWGEAVRQGRPIILNDFQAPHPLKKGYPEGHSHLSNFMTVPLYSGKRIIAVVGLANKKTDYDEGDVLQTTLLMDSVWKIIDRQQAEDEIEQLETQTQKLESLGLLAGGIAHDFNNLLTAIMGNISLAMMHMPAAGRAKDMLHEAEKASERARDLTLQLLTFAKGGAPIKETSSIAGIIKDSAGFALRGSNIAFDLVVSEGLWHVDVDAGQMSQVFHNLVINASHAMPDGGTISVYCENLDLQNACDVPVLTPGRYVKISVKDQGIGISGEYLTRIFDPYFTTKQKGSGLGLATVYSIVRKHDGHITVESELGTGSTFHIYLPASAKEAGQKVAPEPVFAHEGSGRILIMDDEETVRNIAGEILKTFGYEVEFARDGAEALFAYRRAASGGQPFDLVIMDLTVPGGMGGSELMKRLLEIDPHVKAIVSSGYSNDPVMAEYQKFGFKGIVAKPYTVLSLAETVKNVLQSS